MISRIEVEEKRNAVKEINKFVHSAETVKKMLQYIWVFVSLLHEVPSIPFLVLNPTWSTKQRNTIHELVEKFGFVWTCILICWIPMLVGHGLCYCYVFVIV